MRKILKFKTALFLSFLFLASVACEKEEILEAESLESNEHVIVLEDQQKETVGNNARTVTTYSCGSKIRRSYSGGGSYSYPSEYLDFKDVSQGTIINITFYAEDIPNHFAVIDSYGNTVYKSGWIGYSNTFGPWGPSLNGPSSKTFSFKKGPSSTYTLDVQTSAHRDKVDTWVTTIACQEETVPPPGCLHFEDSYSGGGRYTYPDKRVDLSFIPSGRKITFNFYALDLPNNFYVKDAAGNIIGSTGWIGYSKVPGPWGPSLNGPSTKAISFIKGNSHIYYLSAMTEVQKYQTDTWASKVCY